MLQGPREGIVHPQIGTVHFRSLLYLALLEQESTIRMPGGLHPAPRLVVGKAIVQRDGLSQVLEGRVDIPAAVFDLPIEHGFRNGQNIPAGVVE